MRSKLMTYITYLLIRYLNKPYEYLNYDDILEELFMRREDISDFIEHLNTYATQVSHKPIIYKERMTYEQLLNQL